MADITMCKGTGCPLKEKCYRHIAPINPHRQSYFVEVPGKQKKNKFVCEYYWEEKN